MSNLSVKLIKSLFAGLIVFLFVGVTTDIMGEVTVSKMLGDNMVLQRDIPVSIWGWADVGENITVSFSKQKKTAVADKDGEWKVKLDSLKADKTPKQLTITGKNTIVIKNILVGDVWVCSGQSNMGEPVWRVLEGKKEVKAANYPTIRLMTVPRAANDFLVKEINVKWYECSPKTIRNFSAVGYFFARELLKELDVPIGLISSSWGGTRIEPWISPEGYRLVPEQKRMSVLIDSQLSTTTEGREKFQKFLKEMKRWIKKAKQSLANKKAIPVMPFQPGKMRNHQAPTKIYNAMIFPLIPYAIRGVLWYQGESNGGEGMSYFNKMQALIGGWRQLWNQGDFPFYFVQLASFRKPTPENPAAIGWGRCREAQRKSLTIPNTGMAVTMDIGDAINIHPRNKQDVGKRLALWALAKDYKKNVVFSGPLYKSMKIEGDKIRISFDSTGSGLMIAEKIALDPVKEIKNGKVKWVSIKGKDKKWHAGK